MDGLKTGNVFTLPGVYEMVPDTRIWPRLRNWLMRRPTPLKASTKLVRWVVR